MSTRPWTGESRARRRARRVAFRSAVIDVLEARAPKPRVFGGVHLPLCVLHEALAPPRGRRVAPGGGRAGRSAIPGNPRADEGGRPHAHIGETPCEAPHGGQLQPAAGLGGGPDEAGDRGTGCGACTAARRALLASEAPRAASRRRDGCGERAQCAAAPRLTNIRTVGRRAGAPGGVGCPPDRAAACRTCAERGWRVPGRRRRARVSSLGIHAPAASRGDPRAGPFPLQPADHHVGRDAREAPARPRPASPPDPKRGSGGGRRSGAHPSRRSPRANEVRGEEVATACQGGDGRSARATATCRPARGDEFQGLLSRRTVSFGPA